MATRGEDLGRPASTGSTAAAARCGTRSPTTPSSNLMYVGTGNGSPWNAQPAQPGRRRQPVSVVDRRAQRRHRRVRLALPGDARRQLGLHRDAADDPRRPHDRRRAAQGDHAGAEERLLLRPRSRQRQVHLGEELRRRQLGDRLRRQRPAGRDAGARAADKPVDSIPGPFGAHNWHAMSFNPKTGLVYLPAQNVPINLMDDQDWTPNANMPGRAARRPGLEHGQARQRAAADVQAVRPAARVGPGRAEGSLASTSTCRRGTAAR